jgi:hypothetical protein
MAYPRCGDHAPPTQQHANAPPTPVFPPSLSLPPRAQYGIPTPKALPAFSPSEAESVAKSFPSPELVIKAQVLAGGRGKGHFDNGFQGGVQMVDS